MRYLVAPEFATKASQLPVDALHVVKSFLDFVSANPRQAISTDKRVHSLLSEASDILVFRSGYYRVLFTFGTNDDGEYLLLLDLISDTASEHSDPGNRRRLFAKRDPRTNGALNPFVNGQISPRVNGRLNPRVNGQINPRVNGQINPRVNGQINPRVNGQINPRVNGQINPRVNSAINPAFNSTINPFRNTLMGGPFLYDLNLNQVGFVVKANDRVSLVFDMETQHTMTAVAHSQGFAVFDGNNDWKEYWIKDGREGYLRFSPEGEWIGFVV